MTRECTFKILGGLEYTEASRPSYWSNDTPLIWKQTRNMKALALESFPLIEDFEIVLESMIDETGNSIFGYHVMFFSPTNGYVASFPWWDNATSDLVKNEFWVLGEHSGTDLRHGDPNYDPARPVSIPLGTFDNPYTGLEQSWEIVIAQHDMYVYVLEGSLEQFRRKKKYYREYHTWFKVFLDRYLEQWQAIKEVVNTNIC